MLDLMLTVAAHWFPVGVSEGSTYQFRRIPYTSMWHRVRCCLRRFRERIPICNSLVQGWTTDSEPSLTMAVTFAGRRIRRNCDLQSSGALLSKSRHVGKPQAGRWYAHAERCGQTSSTGTYPEGVGYSSISAGAGRCGFGGPAIARGISIQLQCERCILGLSRMTWAAMVMVPVHHARWCFSDHASSPRCGIVRGRIWVE